MYDGFYIFLLLFTGPVAGLVAGRVRQRDWVSTITNVIVAEAFVIASNQLWFTLFPGNAAPPFGRGASIALFYATPVLGAFIGLAVLGLFRRWVLGEQLKKAWGEALGDGTKIAGYLLLALFLLMMLIPAVIVAPQAIYHADWTLLRAIAKTVLGGAVLLAAPAALILIGSLLQRRFRRPTRQW